MSTPSHASRTPDRVPRDANHALTTMITPPRGRTSPAATSEKPTAREMLVAARVAWLSEGDQATEMGSDKDDLGPHLPIGEGHDVIDPTALDAAIDATGYAGSLDALSGSDEQRARVLLEYRSRVTLYKRHLIGRPSTVTALDALALRQPNLTPVISLVRQAAALSVATGRPLRCPPLLVLGPPGVGKSMLARALADALATPLTMINGSTIPDMQSIVGYPPVWRASGPGYLAKTLVYGSTSTPIVFLDEVEKVRDPDRAQHPADKLLLLLEQHTAAQFEDEFLRVPMRAHHVLWICAANTLDGLSAPLLDRVVVVEVPALSQTEREAILVSLLTEVAAAFGLTMTFENANALEPFHTLSLRRARLGFELAVAQAVAQNRRFIRRSDAEMALQVLGHPQGRAPIGFITHPDRSR